MSATVEGGRVRVALVFGGRSGEHEVSLVSARSVRAALLAGGFDVAPMAIDRSGLWADAVTAAEVLDRCGATPDQAPAFMGSQRLDGRLLDGSVDVVLPILHGPFGEDGTVQGLCEMLDLPYAGCGVAACAVTINKVLTKQILVASGIPTPAFVALSARDLQADPGVAVAACGGLALPVFVKPARMGSSVGISKVKEWGALPPALARAGEFDDLLIVEQGIDAREIEVAVLGGDPPLASVPGEVIPGHEFYDYADKYLDDACRLVAPADLPTTLAEEVRKLATTTFLALGCEGMARVDFLLERAGHTLLVNEVNAIPGFTAISMYPRLLELSGVPYPELLSRLVNLALSRHARRRGLADAALRSLQDRTTTGSDNGR